VISDALFIGIYGKVLASPEKASFLLIRIYPQDWSQTELLGS
jgi:hypothetical protein